MTELSLSDEWQTPPWLMRAMIHAFGPFDLDVAGAEWNHQAPKYFTMKDNALKQAPGRRARWPSRQDRTALGSPSMAV